MNHKNLYVVTAIDTEGPIDDPRKPDILNSWERVDALVSKLFGKGFRNAVMDSDGKGIIISWFILTLTGFKTNPFNRPMGYHQVFDHYTQKYGEAMKAHGDGIYWHYHQPAISGIGNEWCNDWIHTNEYDNILARLLLERQFFPACFRAGGRIENNDTSWWLEDTIPFDYSCCSGNINWDNIESDGHRLKEVCDWSAAPADWSWYHPSSDSYQLNGSQRRYIFRCPDLASPTHTLRDDDIRRAFERADGGNHTVLAFFEHDRRDNVLDKFMDVYHRIDTISSEYPDVTWRYTNAQDAAVSVCGLEGEDVPSFSIERYHDHRILITARSPIWGKVPFVAISDGDGSICRRAGLTTVGKYKWLTDPVPAEISRIGVASSSLSGKIGCTVVDLQ